MLVNTARFGQLEINEEEIINFPHGLPGFLEMKKFIYLEHQPGSPFRFMQSLDNPDLTFVVGDPFFFFPIYEFDLPSELITSLQLESPKEAEVWTLVVIPENPKEMTANLQGPIIVNRQARLGQQLILQEDRYTTRHLLFSPSDTQEAVRG